MNTNRDAANPGILADAVNVWIGTQPGDDEADMALEAVLLAQGVMSPEDAVESIESEDASTVVVTFDNMDTISINCFDGTVTAVE